MNIKISSPEILIVSSCVLFCMGHITAAIVFVSLGVSGAIARVALENNIRTEKLTHEQELRDTIGRTISSVVESVIKHAVVPPPMGFDDDDTSIN